MKLLESDLLWAHGARPEYALDEVPMGDEWYIPARVLPLVRPGRDLIILPKNEQVRDFARFICTTCNIDPGQIIWTAGNKFLLDDEIPAVLGELRAKAKGHLILPYSPTPAFYAWSNELDLPVFADSEEFVARYGHKGILHATPDQQLEFPAGIPTARGYFCRTQAELVLAFDLLNCPCLIKPTLGSSGEGILTATLKIIASYSFPLGPVVLEEKLSVDQDATGAEISCSIQFNGQEILGNLTDQLVHNFGWAGNRVLSRRSKKFQESALSETRTALTWLREKGLAGPGGFDFLSVGGQPILVDVNVGRFTGAHGPKIFGELYAPGMGILAWKIHPSGDLSVWRLWQKLEDRKIALYPVRENSTVCHPEDFISNGGNAGIGFSALSELSNGVNPGITTRGVFPLCYLPGVWGMLMAFAPSHSELSALQTEAMDCLK